jgi:hypothetical protein
MELINTAVGDSSRPLSFPVALDGSSYWPKLYSSIACIYTNCEQQILCSQIINLHGNYEGHNN